MSKRIKLIVSSVALGFTGLIVAVINFVPSSFDQPLVTNAPKPSFEVGQKIGFPPNLFQAVRVENSKPVTQERHYSCDKPYEKTILSWSKGDRCQIGNEHFASELKVISRIDEDHLLLSYLPSGHDHAVFLGTDSRFLRCPHVVFKESPSWLQNAKTQYDDYEADRQKILKAIADEAAADAETPTLKPEPPAPKPEPPKAPPPPAFHIGQTIPLRDGFIENVMVQNPDGSQETRMVSHTSKKEVNILVKFGKTCVVKEDGKMHSVITVIGTEGDDVLLRWNHPGWHFHGHDAACPESVMFFRSTAWVKQRLGDEMDWKIKRTKVLKALEAK